MTESLTLAQPTLTTVLGSTFFRVWLFYSMVGFVAPIRWISLRYLSLFIIVLALTGCLSISPGIPNIFLVSLHNSGENTTQVSVGYFGKLSNLSL